jgi:hypothetical protein
VDSLNLLKQEINQTLESEHDFAKWKLIVTAALGGAAMGLDKSGSAHIWLLLLVPFACAYIDLHLSQYQARILVMAQFIRQYEPSGHGEDVDYTLPRYEKYCEQLRSTQGHFFDLGQFAHQLASFGISIAAPFVSVLAFWQSQCPVTWTFWQRTSCAWHAFVTWIPSLRHLWATLLWVVGLWAIWKVWSSQKHRLAEMKKNTFHVASQRIARMIQPAYSLAEIQAIHSFLEQIGTFKFFALSNGLFPAAGFAKEKDKTQSGYSNVWVRDNVHIAYAHYVVGKPDVARNNLSALMNYFTKYPDRFSNIITGKVEFRNSTDPISGKIINGVMNRPHIRFNGETLEENPEVWAHDQNDALGYFLWMFCKLVNEGVLTASSSDLDTLDLFPQYFDKITFWKDEDSGHWEEDRKISASSIGTVVASLTEMEKLLVNNQASRPNAQEMLKVVKRLIAHGRAALSSILPSECIQPEAKLKPYDAALLFLIYPLQVLQDKTTADAILTNTREQLQGEYGIRRYVGDSYWAPDYKTKLAEGQRTTDFSNNIEVRNRLLTDPSQGAQWSLFDPIISCIYATRFRSSVRNGDLARQSEYLNRSLGQLTSEMDPDFLPYRCPELYYMENGHYVPNDHVPLQWTQANLMMALHFMEESCKWLAEAQGRKK